MEKKNKKLIEHPRLFIPTVYTSLLTPFRPDQLKPRSRFFFYTDLVRQITIKSCNNGNVTSWIVITVAIISRVERRQLDTYISSSIRSLTRPSSPSPPLLSPKCHRKGRKRSDWRNSTNLAIVTFFRRILSNNDIFRFTHLLIFRYVESRLENYRLIIKSYIRFTRIVSRSFPFSLSLKIFNVMEI